ncbi:MAG: hypothetical protein AAF479_04695 [Pseudomonadota bacterium]
MDFITEERTSPDATRADAAALPDRSSEAVTDMTTAIATRVMAEAGALLEEFKMKKLLASAKENYQQASNEEKKRIAMALITVLALRLLLPSGQREGSWLHSESDVRSQCGIRDLGFGQTLPIFVSDLRPLKGEV